MTTQPNLDLLQRQRTFSIDETREQLQQGRPVQRLAVTSGEVDYGMMMYGDGYQLPTATAVDTKESSIDAQVGKVATSVAPKTAGSWAALVKSASSSGNNTEAAKPSTPKASEMKKIAPPPSPVKKSSTSVSSPPKTSSDAQIPSSPAKDSSRGKIKTQKPSETTNIEESKEKNVSTSVTIDVPNQVRISYVVIYPISISYLYDLKSHSLMLSMLYDDSFFISCMKLWCNIQSMIVMYSYCLTASILTLNLQLFPLLKLSSFSTL